VVPDRRIGVHRQRDDAATRAGLLFRPAKQHARLGIDSIAVLALYIVGVIGLVALPS
jgi:hypothetical protein